MANIKILKESLDMIENDSKLKVALKNLRQKYEEGLEKVVKKYTPVYKDTVPVRIYHDYFEGFLTVYVEYSDEDIEKVPEDFADDWDGNIAEYRIQIEL